MARKGINKAIESQFQFFENKRLLSDSEYSRNRTCIFISHKKEDMVKAREVANYVMDCGVDIFFDENDPILSNPETNNDPVKVTTAINKALTRSTHMICVVSSQDMTLFEFFNIIDDLKAEIQNWINKHSKYSPDLNI